MASIAVEAAVTERAPAPAAVAAVALSAGAAGAGSLLFTDGGKGGRGVGASLEIDQSSNAILRGGLSWSAPCERTALASTASIAGPGTCRSVDRETTEFGRVRGFQIKVQRFQHGSGITSWFTIIKLSGRSRGVEV